MTSWRDSASQQAQDDLEGLLNTVLPFAVQTLERRGEFYPFGATLTKNGETRAIAADPGTGEHPDSNDILAVLYNGVVADKDSLRAAAYVADVLVDGGDAIRVELEHSDSIAITVFVPYIKSRFRKSIKVGDLRVQSATPHAWAG